MRKTFILSFFWLAYQGTLPAQLFPGLEGEELEDAIRANYTPAILLNDTQAKDTLYARIFRWQDSVRCIYTGLSRHLPEGVDPSQWLFGNGTEIGSINLEHAWPQAKGAGEGMNGNTDMHHLYPSRTDVNSVRANHPFAEIEDPLTFTWYYRDTQMSSIPTQNIEAYSEYQPLRFEPRESVKGDIARAMMYFWTIYREDAEAADPFFFLVQRDIFCAWHLQDPADQDELDRTWSIAQFQDGKPNPFILDCSLAHRLYCADQPACLVAVNDPQRTNAKLLFDPLRKQYRVVADYPGEWDVHITDALGRLLKTEKIQSAEWVSLDSWPPAVYYIMATDGMARVSIPVIIAK